MTRDIHILVDQIIQNKEMLGHGDVARKTNNAEHLS
jgi:hypothetical protein